MFSVLVYRQSGIMFSAIYWNAASNIDVVGSVGWDGLATTAAVHNISGLIQCPDYDKSSCILQLIKGKWEISKNYSNVLEFYPKVLMDQQLLCLIFALKLH